MHDDELHRFKSAIHFLHYAADRYGYRRSRRESSVSSHVPRHPATDDKIVVRKDRGGHWTTSLSATIATTAQSSTSSSGEAGILLSGRSARSRDPGSARLAPSAPCSRSAPTIGACGAAVRGRVFEAARVTVTCDHQ
jgi:hypothetical protein